MWELCYRFFSSVFSFCKKKGYCYWKTESVLQTAPNWPKIWKMAMASQFSDMTLSSNFFDVVLFLLSSSYWSKFHVNIITGSGIITIFFYKRLTRNTEIGNTPASEFCTVSGDWCKLWIPNLARMSLIKYYCILQNSRVAAFTVFEFLRENQLGGGKIAPT